MRAQLHWIRDPRAAARKLANRRRPGTRLASAPFPVAHYDELLGRLRTDCRVRVVPFDDAGGSAPGPTAVVRHDVDTAACVAGAVVLLDADARAGVPSSVFLRMDGLDYEPALAAPLAAECGRRGVAVGLHSSCYRDRDDPVGAFRAEVDRFAEVVGRAPDLLTMHGLGAHNLDVRRQFVDRVARDPAAFGLRFTDASPVLRRYAHVFEDCHLDADGGRFLRTDFADPCRHVGRAGAHLVLTHPCYWE